MAEKIVSPGVFTNEVDQSFLPAGVQAIGAAVVGPTAKGPAGIPTIVSSYSEFVQKFGGKITSGSGASENSYKFLTNYAAKEYLKYADTLTVVRILAGNYGPANSVVSSSVSSGATFASSSMTFAAVPDCDPDIITAAAALDAVIPKFVVAIVLLIASLNAAATVVVVVAAPSLAN